MTETINDTNSIQMKGSRRTKKKTDRFRFLLFCCLTEQYSIPFEKEKNRSKKCLQRHAYERMLQRREEEKNVDRVSRHELKWIINDYKLNIERTVHRELATENWMTWIEPNECIITFWLEKLFSSFHRSSWHRAEKNGKKEKKMGSRPSNWSLSTLIITINNDGFACTSIYMLSTIFFAIVFER